MEKMKAPWGWQKSIVKKNNYHLKELVILPGKKISLQKHFKRSELWTVLKGEALVNLEKEEIFLSSVPHNLYLKNTLSSFTLTTN